jgi:hypothetical protein
MKISVTTNFGLNEAQLETQSAKLRDLLGELDRKHGVTAAILDVNEEVHSGYLIAINGQPL